MTADGRFDMMDVMAMMAGKAFNEPESCGRIVTGFNGVILGLERKSNPLEDRTVYEIQDTNGVLTLKKQGKSHIDFNSSNVDIGTLLLTQQQRLILTDTEEKRMELEEEIDIKGFFKTRDRYLVESDENVEGAEEKLKVLSIMYPMSKHPDKWV